MRPNPFPTIGEIVFDDLRRRILTAQYKPGRKLVEGEVARVFGVSRTPVREAFRKLDLEGLVQYLPRRGVVVRGVSVEEAVHVFVILEALQGIAARLAALRISPGDLARLHDLHGVLSEMYRRGEFSQAVRVHTRFNRLLFAASGNPPLARLLSQFDDYVAHTKTVSVRLPGRASAVRREHDAIVSAVAAGNPRAAEAAALRHVRNARRAFLKAQRATARTGDRLRPASPGGAQSGG